MGPLDHGRRPLFLDDLVDGGFGVLLVDRAQRGAVVGIEHREALELLRRVAARFGAGRQATDMRGALEQLHEPAVLLIRPRRSPTTLVGLMRLGAKSSWRDMPRGPAPQVTIAIGPQGPRWPILHPDAAAGAAFIARDRRRRVPATWGELTAEWARHEGKPDDPERPIAMTTLDAPSR